MERITTTIPQADIDRQLSFCREIAQINAARPQPPLAFVDTYGCQQNEADSERLRGYLSEMGYQFTQSEAEADLIVINTCAIREHAEDAGAGQRGRAGAHQAGQARPAHLRVRLHGPGAPHGAEDQGLLPAGGSGLRPPRPVAVPGAALPPCDPPGAHLRHRRRARLHRRGHPPGAPGGGEGVGEHHVRLQQLLHLLHRAYVRGRSAPGGRRSSWTRSAAWWPRGTRTSPCWART